MDLGYKLKKLREEKRFSQQDIAGHLNIINLFKLRKLQKCTTPKTFK